MNVETLRDAVKSLPPMAAPGEYRRFTWDRRRAEIRKRILEDDPNKFLTWSMVHEALFVGDAPWVANELNALQGDDWSRWKKGIAEVEMGAPARLAAHNDTSGNMTHQAYILKQWEDASDKHVEELHSIFEFGGGYGAMARLCKQLGFHGPHLIYDLPEFLLLQRFYLAQTGVHNAVLVPGLDLIRGLEVDLFIAGCSLSEVPFELRDDILGDVKANGYVILYQGHYMKRDNHGYFQRFARRNSHLRWRNYQVPHWKQHWYLVGTS